MIDGEYVYQLMKDEYQKGGRYYLKQLIKKAPKPAAPKKAGQGSFKEKTGRLWSKTYNLLFHEDIRIDLGVLCVSN